MIPFVDRPMKGCSTSESARSGCQGVVSSSAVGRCSEGTTARGESCSSCARTTGPSRHSASLCTQAGQWKSVVVDARCPCLLAPARKGSKTASHSRSKLGAGACRDAENRHEGRKPTCQEGSRASMRGRDRQTMCDNAQEGDTVAQRPHGEVRGVHLTGESQDAIIAAESKARSATRAVGDALQQNERRVGARQGGDGLRAHGYQVDCK
jgi:hypothetical protein